MLESQLICDVDLPEVDRAETGRKEDDIGIWMDKITRNAHKKNSSITPRTRQRQLAVIGYGALILVLMMIRPGGVSQFQWLKAARKATKSREIAGHAAIADNHSSSMPSITSPISGEAPVSELSPNGTSSSAFMMRSLSELEITLDDGIDTQLASRVDRDDVLTLEDSQTPVEAAAKIYKIAGSPEMQWYNWMLDALNDIKSSIKPSGPFHFSNHITWMEFDIVVPLLVLILVIGAVLFYMCQIQPTEELRESERITERSIDPMKKQSMLSYALSDASLELVDREELTEAIPRIHHEDIAGVGELMLTRVSDDGKCAADSKRRKVPCSAYGLDEEQHQRRLKLFGPNRITPAVKENKWIALLRIQFLSGFNILLWSCVAAEVALGTFLAENTEESEEKEEEDFATPMILAFVIVSSSFLQWWSEQKAESMMNALSGLQSKELVPIVRHTTDSNGDDERLNLRVDPEDLVPGDIIFLESGARIPADCRVIYCTDGTEVDQAALTGESMPEARDSKAEPASTPQSESHNLIMFGTLLLKGNVTAVVFRTGDSTVLGRIAQGISRPRPRSSLEIAMEHFVEMVAFISIGVGVFTAFTEYTQGEGPRAILEVASSSMFGQIPEGLLPTATISLLIASFQMGEANVLIRKLDSVETLGCIEALCSDKTGTLTTGDMAVTDLLAANGSHVSRVNNEFTETAKKSKDFQAIWICGVLNTGVSCDDYQLPPINQGAPKKNVVIGSPTEVAVFFSSLCNLDRTQYLAYRGFRAVFDIPFNSANKYMVTVHEIPAGEQGNFGGHKYLCVVKGAPDNVIPWIEKKRGAPLNAGFTTKYRSMMAEGKRVIAVARQAFSKAPSQWKGTTLDDMTVSIDEMELCGLFGLEDPPKLGVKEAVEKCGKAGVRVVMITGDHAITARAIAGQIGVLTKTQAKATDAKDKLVVTGPELEKHAPTYEDFNPDGEKEGVIDFWKQCVEQTCVFARVSPMDKKTIVQAYQKFGHQGHGSIVAMTGDGVNDAPALKAAEVGIAMGIRGTEVAKDAAGIVLLDDNFASIVGGIEQGRLSSDNLRKSIAYTLCSKMPQFLPTLFGVFGFPVALTITQILAVDIGTDVWTSIAYALQPPETSLMSRKPRHHILEPLVDKWILQYSYGYVGLLQFVACSIMYVFVCPGMLDLISQWKHPDEYSEEELQTYALGTTVYYWTLVVGQFAAALATTTVEQSLFTYGMPNITLNLFIVGEALLAWFLIYDKGGQAIMGTTDLSAYLLIMPLFICFLPIMAIEEFRKKRSREKSARIQYSKL